VECLQKDYKPAALLASSTRLTSNHAFRTTSRAIIAFEDLFFFTLLIMKDLHSQENKVKKSMVVQHAR
jgi:hypothetical protein